MGQERQSHAEQVLYMRRTRALQMLVDGKTKREIAATLGVSVNTVSKDISWMIEHEKADAPQLVNEIREIESQRLDGWLERASRLLENVDPDVSLKALDRLVKIAERRAKLLGLDAPVKQEIETSVKGELSPADVRAAMKVHFPNAAVSPVVSSDDESN